MGWLFQFRSTYDMLNADEQEVWEGLVCMKDRRGLYLAAILIVGIAVTISMNSILKRSSSSGQEAQAVLYGAEETVPETLAEAEAETVAPAVAKAFADGSQEEAGEAAMAAEAPAEAGAPAAAAADIPAAGVLAAGAPAAAPVYEETAAAAPRSGSLQSAEKARSAVLGETAVKDDASVSKQTDGGAVSETLVVMEIATWRMRLEELDARIENSQTAQETPSTSNSIKSQAANELKLWENELNALYSEILKELDQSEAQQLAQQQREWMKERDSRAMEAARSSPGGTTESVEYTESLAESTRERAYALLDAYEMELDL